MNGDGSEGIETMEISPVSTKAMPPALNSERDSMFSELSIHFYRMGRAYLILVIFATLVSVW